DPALAAELAGLLAHTGAGERIGCIVDRIALEAAPAGIWIGRRFGPYRVVREAGHGGMGVVLEAVRDDDEYRKRVALKAAPWWRDVDLLRERFRHERQILAGLEHPNIARFLDGGTENGIPYFVMEYVDGLAITDYCRDLAVRDRIELFRQVCAAVHYAHDNLVVHRDLKPSNILVGQDGAPKLLDFGIAKLLSPTPGGETTATGLLWTPDYASPEQVRGGPASIRTDVYALGLVLYEALTGEPAQRADTSSPLALDRSICESEPKRLLTGDLGAIVDKAIRKEPERRYGSAAELSEDLRRYLEGRPVMARPGTLLYRAGKLVRRHRVAVTAGLALAASVVAGVVSTVNQARRAERRFEEVRSLANTFLFDFEKAIHDVPGTEAARGLVIEQGLRYLERLAGESAGDLSLSREIARGYLKMVQLQSLDYDQSSSAPDRYGKLESSRRAVAVLRLGGAHYSRDTTVRSEYVAALLALSSALTEVGDLAAAADTAVDAVRRAEETHQAQPDDREAANTLARAYQRRRHVRKRSDPLGAVEDGKRANAVWEQLVRRSPADRPLRTTLSISYLWEAALWNELERWDDGVQASRRGLELLDAMARERPEDLSLTRTRMAAEQHLGVALCGRGDREGLDHLRTCVELVTRVHKDSQDSLALQDHCNSLTNLGTYLNKLGDPREARQHLEGAVHACQTVAQRDHQLVARANWAEALAMLADN
ncbi:MAG TPA: serine/threonine-protein kinase, partial [Bryobacteraceae bacterium]